MNYKTKWNALKKHYVGCVGGSTLIEVADDCRLLIERHLGVLAYDSEKISVKTTYGCVSVFGCNLELMQMTKAMLVITGEIMSIVMQRG